MSLPSESALREHFRTPLKHASMGLLAAMRNCPWAADSVPSVPHSYTANDRPACARWKAGDRVLSPWIRTHVGLELFYETPYGSRAGEIRTVLFRGARARFKDSPQGVEGAAGRMLRALERGADDLVEAEMEAGFRCVESREAWHYQDPTTGLEAIDCRLCLRMILEVQGARADHLAEQAAQARTERVRAELDAEREQALIERGTCPLCSGELGRHDFEGLRVCLPCGFEWGRRVRGALGAAWWQLLNSTNRGTNAHT